MTPLEHFPRTWLDAWNRHDLDAILALYEEDFRFSSPVLLRLMPDSGGCLVGKDAARRYWSRAFAPGVNLHFTLTEVLTGADSLVIRYRGLHGRACAEFFQFGAAGRVCLSHAHEAAPPPA